MFWEMSFAIEYKSKNMFSMLQKCFRLEFRERAFLTKVMTTSCRVDIKLRKLKKKMQRFANLNLSALRVSLRIGNAGIITFYCSEISVKKMW
jgi:hypothetical protein